ncbi:degV family protein [Syntrophobotulus glycolicus DSM 8271]|uniref:DegV family protein n=1 Tax=Syntrophobotulus glycolicus (strain DSM 8271 / FlGlyR) TaxID=645991 RepID=F0SY95_SYNGF|nr:DegV family protein [Syntrophobotulus glycolicus]ADY55930.1 degV family protein [Syntrophobotulus glycolicus DSM 8271]
MGVQILTDSTSYLPKDIIEELGINVASLNISFDGESRREIDIDNQTFYQTMSERGIPKSSQPSAGELYHMMFSAIEKGDSLCCIFLSSEMSGTFTAAYTVKEMILREKKDAEIEIIDSKSNSMQLGFAVITAARAAKAGKTLSEVKEAVLQNIKRSRFLFIPDSLEYLKKGGRIGNASALIGNLFKIIPILTVESGKTTTFMKVRTKKNAVQAMLEKMMEDIAKFGLGEVIVHHINCWDEAKEIVQVIERRLKVMAKIISIGPVIGLHVGPGSIGIVYYTNQDMRE